MTAHVADVQVKKDAQDRRGELSHQYIYPDRYRLVVHYKSLNQKSYRIINKKITEAQHKMYTTFLGILNPDGSGDCIITDKPSHDVQCLYSLVDIDAGRYEVIVIHDKHLADGLEVVKHRYAPPLEVQLGYTWHVNTEYAAKRQAILDYLSGN